MTQYALAIPASRVCGPRYWTGGMPAHPTLCQPIATLDPADAKRWPSAEAAVAFANATHPNIVKQGFEVVEVDSPDV